MSAPLYEDEILALERGLGSGEAKIESDGESIVYRGVTDIMKALEYFRRQAASAIVVAPRPASTVAVYDPR